MEDRLQDSAPALAEVDRLKREVESLRDRLAKLNEASLGIAGSLEIDTVLQAVIDASRLLTGARYGAILTFDDSGEIESFITSGISPEERRMVDMPRGLGILGYMNELEGPLEARGHLQPPQIDRLSQEPPAHQELSGDSHASRGEASRQHLSR